MQTGPLSMTLTAAAKPRILFIDDEPLVLQSYRRLLKGQCADWVMEYESCPVEALRSVRTGDYDAVVSDVRMPRMNGIELLKSIKDDDATRDVPVIIITGESDQDLKRRALSLDAADLLSKPIRVEDLVVRLRNVLRLRECMRQLRRQNEILESRVEEAVAEIERSRIDILWRLGKAAEYRDEETGNHVMRVGAYSKMVAQQMGVSRDFSDRIFLAAPLHDIGKIGVPDSILLNPGKLSEEEWALMRQHCSIGVSILTDPYESLDVEIASTGSHWSKELRATSNSILVLAAEIALTHHERWDGSGYPRGLVGDEIPLSGRIVAIADVYDALRSPRPYKEPFSQQQSLEIVQSERGAHFDPDVVDAFLAVFDHISELDYSLCDEVDTSHYESLDAIAGRTPKQSSPTQPPVAPENVPTRG